MKFHVLLIVFFFQFSFYTFSRNPVNTELSNMAQRIVGERAVDFIFEIKDRKESVKDYFEIASKGSKILITGNNGISLARGFNFYLREYCHSSFSQQGINISLPDPLPVLPRKIFRTSSFEHRYFLNYCTYSYSMPFWNWADWEKAIDWMALQGINMPLMAVYGQYGVWKNTLERLGCSEKEIKEFLPGAAYEAWWLMGNLEGFGGPVSDEFIAQQIELQQKILNKIRLLGMKPVFQGFYGMIPNSFIEKYPQAKIHSQGKWMSYQRPAFLDPTDPLFGEIATVYYEEQKKLFGEVVYFGGDPFHEGGITDGIDVKNAARTIHDRMKQSNPNAKWILQGWQTNPRKDLLEGLNYEDVIILDLMACESPQWRGDNDAFDRPEGHMGYEWIWCALPNFGGKTGLHGKFSSYAHDPYLAKNSCMGKNISGIGVTSEGFGTIPVVYDMVFDMAWREDSIVIDEWLSDYIISRYGAPDNHISQAWKLLSETSYECHNKAGGPVESYLCARPADTITRVSSWGNAVLFYDPIKLTQAWSLFLKGKDRFGHTDTYQYDLVNLTRQVLADYAKSVHSNLFKAYAEKDLKQFNLYADRFLNLLMDMDVLLGTRKEFLLGSWLAQAQRCAPTEFEKKQFLLNAKCQVTTWSDIDSKLHDYANKEWSGLLSDFYYPRWKMYFDYKEALLKGENASSPDFPDWEQEWIRKDVLYPDEPNGKDPVRLAEDIFDKYGPQIFSGKKSVFVMD